MTAPKTIARIAGLFYVLNGAGFIFAESVRSRIFVPGDGAATAENIRASTTLFHAALVVNLVSGASLVLAAMALYLLLKHVNGPAAAAMVTFAAIACAIMDLNLLNQYAALAIATQPDYTSAFGQAGSDGLVMLFAQLQGGGLLIVETFWGLWLLPLGYLVIKSGYFPRVLGALLIVACFSWIARQFVQLLAPDLGGVAAVLAAGAVGELTFLVWLLVKGPRVPAAEASVPAMAD